MRYGFTTGSCAAAAAKAAAYMLLTGYEKNDITIQTPKGILYRAQLVDIRRNGQECTCAVIKDSGDDPDVTNGIRIYARVSFSPESVQQAGNGQPLITIDGGEGIGRVTLAGLDQPVGAAAINRVPREMIEEEVRQVCELCDYHGNLSVIIYAPEGVHLAPKTFNPRLGIEGGISILGTSGIVEPMSSRALLETIRVELRQQRVLGACVAAVAPGNYGLEFMKRTYGYDLEKSIKCSNYIGETIDMAVELGFSGLLLTGHIGKLVKLSGGIMNTHSREGDCRMELLTAAAVRVQAPAECLPKLLSCATTEEALKVLDNTGFRQCVMDDVMEHIAFYLDKRTAGKLTAECIMYSMEYGELAATAGAKQLIEGLCNDG